MKDEHFAKAMEALESAARFEKVAAAREDWVYVEQLYWRAYNALRESDDAESRFQRSFCLERIADILESERARGGSGEP